MDATQIPDNQPVGGDYSGDITNLQNQINDLVKVSEDLNTAVASPSPLQYPIDPISYNSIANAFPNILGGGLPATPSQGDVIYYNGTAWVSLAPGTSGQLLETLGAGNNPQWAMAVATGSVMLFGTATPPTGWLLCNGQGVSTSTYSTLFALIGYTYGGSGSTFDVPNLNSPYLIVQTGETAQVLSGAYYYDIYTTPGSYNWQCPKGVTTVYVQCYGGGGSGTCGSGVEAEGGGGGGGFGYKTITVVPGTIYPLFVGAGGGTTSSGYSPGQSSNFISSGTVQGNGGSTSSASSAGGYVGDSGYNGGAGGWGSGLSGSAGNGYGGGGGTSSGLAGGGGGGAAGNGTNLGSGAGGGGTGNAGTPGAGGGNYLQFGGQNAVGMTGGVFGGGGAGFYGSGLSGAGGSGAVYVQYAPPPLSYIIKT